MVLMALDHVRVYAGIPAGGPTAGLFFTRWVTHFCAPAFVFFAGSAAFLHGAALANRAALARHLATRGLVLIVLELTLIRVMWTFNFDFQHYLLAGVIWVIGWCMILLAAMLRLPSRVIGIAGLVLIFGQKGVGALADAFPSDSWGWLWQVVYFGGVVQWSESGPAFAVLYSIVPWAGVMAAGYGFGEVFRREPAERTRTSLRIGLLATVLFLILRWFDVYGDPRAWRDAPAQIPGLFRFLNTAKYPASPLFLLMTLGPTLALLPLAERARGGLSEVLATFGRVPMFYYLLHIPMIHLAAIAVSFVREGAVNPWLFESHPMMPPPVPDGYQWSLAMLYIVTLLIVAALYFPCRWYAALKQRRRNARWLSYL